MLNIFISLLTFVLILISLFLILVILMQRANSNSGMGSAFGGGVTESAFGAETTNILTKATKWASLSFFVLALVLYLLYMSNDRQKRSMGENGIPEIPVMESPEELPVDVEPVDSETVKPMAEEAETTPEAVPETSTPAP